LLAIIPDIRTVHAGARYCGAGMVAGGESAWKAQC